MPYSSMTVQLLEELENCSITDRLNIAFAVEHSAKLYSINPKLVGNNKVLAVPLVHEEREFSHQLEKNYRQSLELRTAKTVLING